MESSSRIFHNWKQILPMSMFLKVHQFLWCSHSSLELNRTWRWSSRCRKLVRRRQSYLWPTSHVACAILQRHRSHHQYDFQANHINSYGRPIIILLSNLKRTFRFAFGTTTHLASIVLEVQRMSFSHSTEMLFSKFFFALFFTWVSKALGGDCERAWTCAIGCESQCWDHFIYAR